MSGDLVTKLRQLVSLNEPAHGGPYGGSAAEACMEAMAEAADRLEEANANEQRVRRALALLNEFEGNCASQGISTYATLDTLIRHYTNNRGLVMYLMGQQDRKESDDYDPEFSELVERVRALLIYTGGVEHICAAIDEVVEGSVLDNAKLIAQLKEIREHVDGAIEGIEQDVTV